MYRNTIYGQRGLMDEWGIYSHKSAKVPNIGKLTADFLARQSRSDPKSRIKKGRDRPRLFGAQPKNFYKIIDNSLILIILLLIIL